MFLIHTDTSFCTILDFTVIQTCFWSLSILNWPEKERVEQHLRRQGWAAHPPPAERGLLTSRIYRCDLSSELKESSTPTFKVESVHNKKVSKTGTAGKAENFRKLKIFVWSLSSHIWLNYCTEVKFCTTEELGRLLFQEVSIISALCVAFFPTWKWKNIILVRR